VYEIYQIVTTFGYLPLKRSKARAHLGWTCLFKYYHWHRLCNKI